MKCACFLVAVQEVINSYLVAHIASVLQAIQAGSDLK